MASFSSILSNIGYGLKAFFTSPKVDTAIGVGIDLTETLFPGLTPLLSGVSAAAGKAEALAAAAGARSGTGAQKFALALSDAETVFNTYEAARGVTVSASSKETVVNSMVAILNALESPVPTA